MSSIEETIQLARLQQAVSASALYERKHNQKALKVLTVAAYILFVSMAAIILSFYYVFIWDPTTKPVAPRAATNCGNKIGIILSIRYQTKIDFNYFSSADTPKKIVIPESLAIQLANSSEVSAENFFKNIFRRYQRLQRQEERERKLLRKALKSTKPPIRAEANDQNDIDDASMGHIQLQNSTRSTDVPKLSAIPTTVAIVQSVDQNYMDDEDMMNDYDESESSGANRLQLNETSSAYIYDDND